MVGACAKPCILYRARSLLIGGQLPGNLRVCVALQLTQEAKKGNSPVLRSGSVSVSSGTELRVCVSRMFFRNF